MVVRERLYTAEDLLHISNSDDTKRYELIEGELFDVSLAAMPHGLLTSNFNYFVFDFVKDHNLGSVYGAGTGFKLTEDPDTVYGIDVAFVSKARNQKGEGYFIGAPDLAVEIASPGNTKAELHDKVKAYFRAGARLVWLVFPKSRVIYVYRSETDIEVLQKADILDGGDVLPGFSVKVAELFAVLDK